MKAKKSHYKIWIILGAKAAYNSSLWEAHKADCSVFKFRTYLHKIKEVKNGIQQTRRIEYVEVR